MGGSGLNAIYIVSGLTALFVLLLAGLWHASHRDDFRSELRVQGLIPIPPQLLGVAVTLTSAVEASTGAVGVYAFLSHDPILWRWSLGAASVVLGAFTAYLVVLRQKQPNAICGCALGGTRVGPPAVLRNMILGLVSGSSLAASLASDELILHMQPSGLSLLVAAFTLALVAWILPDSLATPEVTRGAVGS